MSRRKQKFPSHITGEGEIDECQEHQHELLTSSVVVETDAPSESSGGDSCESYVQMESPEKNESLKDLSSSCNDLESTVAIRNRIPYLYQEVVSGDEGEGEKDISDRLQIVEKSPSPSPSEGHRYLKFDLYDPTSETNSAKTLSANNVLQNLDFNKSAGSSVINKNSSLSINCVLSSTDGPLSSESEKKFESTKRNSECKCPVCSENFKSKRSFNSHIFVHCQLVKSPALNSNKRSIDDANGFKSQEKRKNNQTLEPVIKSEVTFDPVHFPLDLSCKKFDPMSPQNSMFMKCEDMISERKSSSSELETPHNCSILSDRSGMEDENENLVNEAREHEKAFFNNAQNQLFLTEDSTGLDPPPPLPLFHSGGVTRRVRVSSDEGSPMVYRINTHSEQVFISRILGTNEETGDKIELYKCFMCNVSFPSVSKLQVHLTHHKQRFVCCKCSYSCDSRVDFSHHVQKKHLTNQSNSERSSTDFGEDSTNAENTVTVAALLSALHGKKFSPVNSPEKRNEIKPEELDIFPSSPSSESPVDASEQLEVSGGGGDMFKMFSCRFCGKKFDRAFSCNRHERVHTGFKPCFCRICGRGFSEPRNLRHHVIRFHSDGSLRHLIKRDRRKRKGEESPPPPSKDLFTEGEYLPINSSSSSPDKNSDCSNDRVLSNGLLMSQGSNQHYTNNLTKMFAATLDQSTIMKRVENLQCPRSSSDSLTTGTRGNLMSQASMFRLPDDNSLEPGEIRLNIKTRIIDDEERGRRLIIAEDQSEDESEHSSQFSSYAPRLNIVQDPVQRTKALVPITDDIGRTFYECPYCHKFFGSTSDLNRHLDFHEDLRPYECGYCDYSARTNSQLKVHKMRHEGIKQFSCEICNYNGVTQSDLNRHKKTQSHIARSQNVCRRCGLGFYSNTQKQTHIAKCHPEMEGASSLVQLSSGIPISIADEEDNLHQPSTNMITSCPQSSSPINISSYSTPVIISSSQSDTVVSSN